MKKIFLSLLLVFTYFFATAQLQKGNISIGGGLDTELNFESSVHNRYDIFQKMSYLILPMDVENWISLYLNITRTPERGYFEYTST